MIVIRDFRDQDMEGVFTLYREVFGRDALERWKKRWHWQFRESAASDVSPSRMWVGVDERASIGGFLASFPVRFKLADQEIIIHHPCDLMVSRDMRGRGLGQELIRTYIDSTNSLANALVYSAAAESIYRKLGYRSVYSLPTYLRIWDIKSVVKFLMTRWARTHVVQCAPSTFFLDIIGACLHKIVSVTNKSRSPKASAKYVIEQVSQAGSEFDLLWKNTSSHFPIAAIRDSKFIQWRFLADPLTRHRLYCARDKDGIVQGYIDLCAQRKGGLTVGRIMDLFCNPGYHEIAGSLLYSAFQFFGEIHVDLSICTGLFAPLRNIIKKYFYFRLLQSEKPALFFWKGSPQYMNYVYDHNNWHLSQADGDEGFGI